MDLEMRGMEDLSFYLFFTIGEKELGLGQNTKVIDNWITFPWHKQWSIWTSYEKLVAFQGHKGLFVGKMQISD